MHDVGISGSWEGGGHFLATSPGSLVPRLSIESVIKCGGRFPSSWPQSESLGTRLLPRMRVANFSLLQVDPQLEETRRIRAEQDAAFNESLQVDQTKVILIIMG